MSDLTGVNPGKV